jgi:hypothetical protein
MNHLQSVENVSNRNAVIETNLEALDRSLAFARNPSLVDGEETADPGAPASGAHYVGELWTDVNRAQWMCKTAGSPGVWIQIAPAPVEADPAGVPDGYVIARVVEFLKLYRWNDGGGTWDAV